MSHFSNVLSSDGPLSLQRFSSVNDKIQVFRTASGHEHNLARKEWKNSPNEDQGYNHGIVPLPSISSFTTASESFASHGKRSMSDDFCSTNRSDSGLSVNLDNIVRENDDDNQTLYSHASVLDLDAADDFDILFTPDDINPRRSSFKRSFRRAEEEASKRRTDRQKAVQHQPRKASSVYEKVIKALCTLFSNDLIAKLQTLQYISDFSSAGGGSILSATEREVLTKLIQGSKSSFGANNYFEQAMTPWRSSSFQDDGLRVRDSLISSLIIGENKLQLVKSPNSSADFIHINLAYAGALLVTTAVLAKLRCKPLERKSNGFIKVKCKEAKISFGISLTGNAPCVLRFQRPWIFSICKIDRYVSLVTRLRDLIDEFVRDVHT